MELIDKTAVIAEINRVLNSYDPNQITSGRYALVGLRDFLDTLEVKEVDLEKEFYDFLDTLIGKDNGHLSEDELFRIAEYFFELGLKAKRVEGICKISETNCPNFDEAQGTSFVK